MLAILMVTSNGAAGVTGRGFITPRRRFPVAIARWDRALDLDRARRVLDDSPGNP